MSKTEIHYKDRYKMVCTLLKKEAISSSTEFITHMHNMHTKHSLDHLLQTSLWKHTLFKFLCSI